MIPEALKQHHDKIYVVTDPLFIERQEETRKELGSDNFEFVYSVDRPDVTKEDFIADGTYDEALAVRVDPKGRKMSVGHICCSIGHRNAYQKMLDEGCERALIFEDDVTVLSVDDEIVEAVLANIPPDADTIQWGWNGGRFKPALGALQQAIFHVKYALGSYKLNHRMIRNLYMREYNQYFHVASVNFLAHAYTITSEAAAKLIKMNTPINLNADHVLIHAILNEDIRGYVSATQLFGQRSIDPTDPLESQTQKYY